VVSGPARAFAAAFAATFAASGADDEARSDRDAAWRDFPVFVWFHGGPPPGPVAWATLKAAGLAGANLEASDDAAAGAALRKAGLACYVDHAAGKGDLFLRPAVFDRDRDAWKESLLSFRPARPAVLSSEATYERLAKRVDESVARHRAQRPLCWVLDDELSVTRGVNPMDYCFAPETLAAFRRALAREHGTVEALDRAWGAKWTRLDDVVPPTTAEARAAADGVALPAVNFAAWNAHRRFMEEALAELLARLAARVVAGDPGAPVGFTGGSFPSAFGGFDWRRLAPAMTLFEPYDAGAAPELVDAFAGRDAKRLATLFVSDEPKAGWQPSELLSRVARGDDGAVIWSSGPLLTDDGRALSAAGREVAARVAAARALHRELRDAADAPPRLFVLTGQASARAGWMVDSWGDGATFPNRLTSYESDHSSTATAREAWVELARAWGVPWRFVDTRDGLPAEATRDPARAVLVATEAFALDDALVEALDRFVAAGGRLVGDAHAALFDEQLRGRDGAALRRLFGMERAAGATLDGVAAGDSLVAGADVEKTAVGFERAVGKGRTLWLGRSLRDCVRGPGRAEALRSTAEALRAWLGARGGLGDAIATLDGAAIGKVHLRPIVRADRGWWVVAPTAALDGPLDFTLRAEGGDAVTLHLDPASARLIERPAR